MNQHVLVNLKAYVALLGSLATAMLGVFAADTTIGKVAMAVSVFATAFGTWFATNADEPAPAAPTDAGMGEDVPDGGFE